MNVSRHCALLLSRLDWILGIIIVCVSYRAASVHILFLCINHNYYSFALHRFLHHFIGLACCWSRSLKEELNILRNLLIHFMSDSQMRSSVSSYNQQQLGADSDFLESYCHCGVARFGTYSINLCSLTTSDNKCWSCGCYRGAWQVHTIL